jgi:hypothetical protein
MSPTRHANNANHAFDQSPRGMHLRGFRDEDLNFCLFFQFGFERFLWKSPL